MTGLLYRNKSKFSLGATRICREFYKKLVEQRLHLARADLPRPRNEAAQQRRKSTFRRWSRTAEELLEQYGGDAEAILHVLEWYFAHHRDPGVGAYYALTTFAENIHKIEKVMQWKKELDFTSAPRVIVDRAGRREVLEEGIDEELW